MRCFAGLVAGVALALGCAHAPALVPVAGQVPSDPGAAQVTLRGVQLEVDAAAWAGEPQPLTAVLPLQVRLRNGGRVPLRVDVGALALVGDGGPALSALHPAAMDGVTWVEASREQQGGVPESIEGHGGSGFGRPALEPDREALPPLAAANAGGVEAPLGPPAVQPLDYGSSFGRVAVRLPTESMLRQAFPGGTLAPGEQMEGFVYFPPPPAGARTLRFRAPLVEADTGRPLGALTLPFRTGD